MNGNQAAAALVKQMTLEKPARNGPGRVAHENATPEQRAEMATARLKQADEEIRLTSYRSETRAHAHDKYIHSATLADAVSHAKRALTVDEMALRALLRQAWDAGFTEGFTAGRKFNP